MGDSLRLIFSGVAVVSALAFLSLMIRLHFLPNKFNPVKNTVSASATQTASPTGTATVTPIDLTNAYATFAAGGQSARQSSWILQAVFGG